MKKYLYNLTLVMTLGSGFVLAQNMPQQKDPTQNPPSMPQAQQPPTTDQSKTPTASTAGIQTDIQSAFQKEPSLAGSNIDVHVTNNSVELAGTVSTRDAKDKAEQIANAHAGGLAVKNNIKVGANPGGESPK